MNKIVEFINKHPKISGVGAAVLMLVASIVLAGLEQRHII